MTNETSCCLTLHDSIIVAVDGSVIGESALDEAITITKTCKCRLYVIHVVDIHTEDLDFSTGLQEQLEKDGVKILEKANEKVSAAQLSCETILKFDDQAYRPIVQEAQNRKATLIIVGSHGRGGLGNMLMGSVSQKIIGNSPCPVLVVPRKKAA
jgi:nucleotide-binding universal stress UspA family protein